jgi:hypothetical protein
MHALHIFIKENERLGTLNCKCVIVRYTIFWRLIVKNTPSIEPLGHYAFGGIMSLFKKIIFDPRCMPVAIRINNKGGLIMGAGCRRCRTVGDATPATLLSKINQRLMTP